jgi:hypothetical protein
MYYTDKTISNSFNCFFISILPFEVRFWDSRQDSSSTEIQLQGRLTSLDLTQGMILESQKQISRVRF